MLAGKHALVTGGARGIGAAIVRALEDHGARVTVLGRSTSPIAADVCDAASVGRAFAEAGAVDSLVNNAGASAAAPFDKDRLRSLAPHDGRQSGWDIPVKLPAPRCRLC